MTDPADIYDAVSTEVSSVLIGNEDVIEMLTVSLLTKGHLLLEGVPGVAKTTIANLFARSTGLSVNRIQMTPDILPADITGTHVYREQTGEFELQRGPVFANLIVADEINRATPKTQSALLEAMQERHVTIEGETLELPTPFMVIATQNPIEMEGTFELPEAQRDRFQFKLTVDLPDRDVERELIHRFDADPDLDAGVVEPAVSADELLAAREAVTDVHVDETVIDYVLDVIDATRRSPLVEFGASPRATLAFLNAGKARATISGRDYVIPGDIKALAEPILAHRLVLSTETELADISMTNVIQDILGTVEAPGTTETTVTASDGGHEEASSDESTKTENTIDDSEPESDST